MKHKTATKNFEYPMFRHNGQFLPIGNSISLRWTGFIKNKGNIYIGDTNMENDALECLLAGAGVHERLNDGNWDRVANYAAEIIPGGFGFDIVNYEKMEKDMDEREQK